ncbi:LAFE_0B07052g1_1 [Lachancea fermentati]|uniref:LAFE_0B07052g1_1 n=1 Tax=Lachancea fermentati TaxID=4955 RepID=A0A1G4M823_LACFM|nr:LAFE_0B07052g1_1 [Lachancea fermentati]
MDKYDRQLRLWDRRGQELLTEARICIVGQSSLGQEVLKNLLLPGASNFTVITEKMQSDQSFFEGGSLMRLNPRASIETVCWDTNQMANKHFWEKFDLVVIVTTYFKILEVLSKVKLPRSLICCTHEFSGYVRFISPHPHFVIESHPQHTTPDLRIMNPWTELKYYLESFDFTLEEDDFSDVPYIVIIYQALLSVKKRGDPVSRDAIKEEIRGMRALVHEGTTGANLYEAERFAHLATAQSEKVPDNLVRCFELLDQAPENGFDQTVQILLKSLKIYLGSDYSDKQLPLSGSIPDMISSTENYNNLKDLYQKKAKEDVKYFSSIVAKSRVHIPDTVINTFCKNTKNLRVVLPSRSLCFRPQATQILSQQQDAPTDLVKLLTDLINKQFKISDADSKNKMDTEKQSNSEMKSESKKFYPVISLIAGIAAQESIKILTHQFVPIENTFVYNGISNQSWTLKL